MLEVTAGWAGNGFIGGKIVMVGVHVKSPKTNRVTEIPSKLAFLSWVQFRGMLSETLQITCRKQIPKKVILRKKL